MNEWVGRRINRLERWRGEGMAEGKMDVCLHGWMDRLVDGMEGGGGEVE